MSPRRTIRGRTRGERQAWDDGFASAAGTTARDIAGRFDAKGRALHEAGRTYEAHQAWTVAAALRNEYGPAGPTDKEKQDG